MGPVTVTRAGNNDGFVKAYTRGLVEVMPDLLKNHLYARIESMIALSRTGDAQAVETFVCRLDDPNQVVMVKLLAANGLANVAQDGKKDVDTQTASRAGKALADFLTREQDTFWPAKVRALKALGALRQPSTVRGNFEMASAAMALLSDPKARPDVRPGPAGPSA